MDLIPLRLIPGPDRVVSAAGNIAHKVLYGGLADLMLAELSRSEATGAH